MRMTMHRPLPNAVADRVHAGILRIGRWRGDQTLLTLVGRHQQYLAGIR
jgi:hypothetical protein